MKIYRASEIIKPKYLMDMAWREYHTMETLNGRELIDGQKMALLIIHDLQEKTLAHMIENPTTVPSIHDITPENRHLMLQPRNQKETEKFLKNYKIKSAEFIMLCDCLNKEIRNYISYRYNIPASKLKNNTGWAEIGHDLAEDLISKEISEKGISISRKNNHANNIYISQHFDMVKDLLMSIRIQISEKLSSPVYPVTLISFVDTAIEIQSDVELNTLKNLPKSISDRTIFSHFVKVITNSTDSTFSVLNHVDSLCGIKKYGNFKSLERVLATGRRDDYLPAN